MALKLCQLAPTGAHGCCLLCDAACCLTASVRRIVLRVLTEELLHNPERVLVALQHAKEGVFTVWMTLTGGVVDRDFGVFDSGLDLSHLNKM